MKIILLSIVLFLFVGCGYESTQNELTGQVKRVIKQTPLLCKNRVDADISLGIMRNGVGSMSNEDLYVTIPNKEDQEFLKKAAETGGLVKITYDTFRITWCINSDVVTKVETLNK